MPSSGKNCEHENPQEASLPQGPGEEEDTEEVDNEQTKKVKWGWEPAGVENEQTKKVEWDWEPDVATAQHREEPAARTCNPLASNKQLKRMKKRAGQELSVVLPLYPGNVKTLQAEANVGRHFCQLATRFYPCVVTVDYDRNGASMLAKASRCFLKVWCLPQRLSALEQELKQTAFRVNDRFRQRYEERRQGKMQMNLEPDNWASDELDFPKEDVADLFHRHKDAKRRMRRESEPAPKRCLNCRVYDKTRVQFQRTGTFSSVTGPADSSDPDVPCFFHPGYVQGQWWSCCGEKADGSAKMADMHVRGGCCVGAHVWRCRWPKQTNARHANTKIRGRLVGSTKAYEDTSDPVLVQSANEDFAYYE